MLRWLKAISDHVFVITSVSCPSPVEIEAGSASKLDSFLTVMGRGAVRRCRKEEPTTLKGDPFNSLDLAGTMAM